MKSRYGVTPWGNWFVRVLGSYEVGSRLARGKTYANTGRVLSLELKDGWAVAKVEGNFLPFYRVEINFPPLAQAEKVYEMIEGDPPLLAHIAAGELPETFLQKLIDMDIDLIPRRWQDMKRLCTCPDYGDPCKHMAALYYIIAAEIDADPHVLFRLRGMDLAARFGKAAVRRIAPPFTVAFVRGKKSARAKALPPAASPEIEPIPPCGELISALLPPSPPFSDKDFAAIMADFYRRCAGRYDNGGRHDDSARRHGENLHYGSVRPSRKPVVETVGDSAETEHGFSRSVWTVLCPSPGPGANVALEALDVNGKREQYSLQEAFEYFVDFSSEDGTESYRFLFFVFRFLNLVCSAGAFIPYVLVENKTMAIVWRPFETLPPVQGTLEALASLECGMLAATGGRGIADGRGVVDLLASSFLNGLVRRRFSAERDKFDKYGIRGDFRELLHLFFLGTGVDVSTPATRSLPMAIDQWLSVLHIDFSARRYSLTVKDLGEKQGADGDDSGVFGLSMDVLDESGNGVKKIPLSRVKDLETLRAPIALSNYLPEIRELASREKTATRSVRLSEARMVAFLDSAAGLFTRLGMTVNLPKALHRELKPRLVVKGNQVNKSLVRYLDLNALRDFEWQVAIGDEVLSIDEFEKLLKQKRALIRFRDGFVKINAAEFSRLLKNAKGPRPSPNDFLKAHFSGDTVFSFDGREAIDGMFREKDFPVPADLSASLRPYQKRGYNWVCSLLLSGFGCILADDMGLGKTVQSIAVALRLKQEGLLDNGCLVVAPAALIGNWEKELDRFAPSLGVSRYHGNRRRIDRKHDVFLTTYQTAVRDAEKLGGESFSLLLVDEAHLMKNAGTRLSIAVKQLHSDYRLALSGTPVENRLEDLRSLFDFILPGYLGNAGDFRERYRVPIEVMRDRDRAETLRKITAPFLLRRLKTDKIIIKDLPEKIIVNEYATLEKGQVALYESVVAESIKKSEKAEPGDRSSLIFSMLTSLKQICDHPRVFDKESPAVSGLSGKAGLLLTLLGEILANREKTLVFSQYVETLDCLECIIRKELGEAALIYHGGLGQRVRNETINRFQNDPAAKILLVSLKAGGLGLNLTAASRVIHYDLWYNPAVENQATDRAFRIGQKRNVFVHRLITRNSFEEKIDAMISSKRELADMTVASGESWIARMSHEELRTLFGR